MGPDTTLTYVGRREQRSHSDEKYSPNPRVRKSHGMVRLFEVTPIQFKEDCRAEEPEEFREA